MGPTGAGKTTLCCALRGLLGTFIDGELTGEIELVGEKIFPPAKASEQSDPFPVARLARIVGLVFQDFERQLFSTTVAREVAFGPENLNIHPTEIRRRVDWALAIVGLTGLEDRNPQTLSGGEKQRLAIASILALHPRILLLDEPTTDLDPVGKEQIFSLRREIAEQVEMLVMVEHEIEPALAFEQILILTDGRIAGEGSPQLLLDWRLFEKNSIQPYEPAVLAAEAGLGSYDECALRPLLSGLSNSAALHSPVAPPREAIRFVGITAGYEGKKIIEDFSVTIGEGEFVAILGPNGSGKTTVAKIMAGLHQPSSGRVEIFGKDFSTGRSNPAATKVGYVFQNPDHQIFASTIAEEIAFGPRNVGMTDDEVARRVKDVVRTVGLVGLESADPFTLPKGYRQMVAVASVMAMQPRILILDEPTTGLDLAGQRAILKVLNELHSSGHTIIIITHSMRIALEHAVRTIVMKNGRIILDGLTKDVFYGGDLAQAALRPPPIVELGKMAGIQVRSISELIDIMKHQGRLKGRS